MGIYDSMASAAGPMDDYEKGQVLGKGSTSLVFDAVRKVSERCYQPQRGVACRVSCGIWQRGAHVPQESPSKLAAIPRGRWPCWHAQPMVLRSLTYGSAGAGGR